MRKLFSIVLAFGMTICLMAPVFGITSSGTDTDLEISANEKVYCNATLDDEFTDDGVLVVLSNKASLEFNRFRSTDFWEIGCVAVTDYSSASGEKIKTQVDILSKATASTQELQSVDTAQIQTYNQVLYLKLSNPGKQNVLDAISKLMLREDVIYAGPNYIYSVEPAATKPMIPQNTGAYIKMQLQDAWELTTGSSNVLVGVMDSGIDATHPDLEGRVNDSLSAWFGDGEAHPGGLTDYCGHGTLVAGIIAGQWNNAQGVGGVAPNITLVSLNVMSGVSITYASNILAAINYAEAQGIQILNFSAGISVDDLQNGCLQAAIHNFSGVFVCAAGNDGADLDNQTVYPSGYNTSSDNMIVVGASTAFDEKCAFSNYGSVVDIFAPGEAIKSTASSQSPLYNVPYATESGTSFAAPFVTGVAALILSIDSSLSPQQIIARILLNADVITIHIEQDEQEVVMDVSRLNAYQSLLNITHIWTYASQNLTYHTKACGCGQSTLEYHTWITLGNKYRCGSCGYITNALPEIFQSLDDGKTDCKLCNHS